MAVGPLSSWEAAMTCEWAILVSIILMAVVAVMAMSR